MAVPHATQRDRALAQVAGQAATRHGVFDLDHVREAGLSRHSLGCLLREGVVVRCHVGVYRFASTPESARTRLAAALLAAGPRAHACGWTAARLLGMRCPKGSERREVELVVRGSPALRVPGVRISRTRSLHAADTTEVEGCRTTTAARTLVDLAGTMSHAEFLALLDDALCQRLANRSWLHRRAWALSSGRPGVGRIVAVTRAGAEAEFHSWLERIVGQAAEAAGLPPAEWNVEVFDERGRIGIVDVFWRDLHVVVELEGLRFHDLPTARRRDAGRFNRLATPPRVVRRFTYEDVLTDLDAVIAEIAATLDAAARRLGVALT